MAVLLAILIPQVGGAMGYTQASISAVLNLQLGGASLRQGMEGIGSLLSVGKSWSKDDDYNRSGLNPELRVTAFDDPPYILMQKNTDGTFRYDGYLYNIWQIVADMLNIRYRMVPPVQSGYGNLDPNGNWSGMVGELVYGRADVALTWLHSRPDRAAVIDYIYVPIDNNNDGFYLLGGSDGIPHIGPDMMSSLLKPLHSSIWWALLASLLVISVVLRATLRFSHARAEERQTVGEMSFGSCLLYTYMSLVAQGWNTVPNSLAARTVTIFSWALSIIILNSYTANLISFLTVVKVHRPIHSLREFSEQPDWSLAIPAGYGVVNDWQLSPDVYERELYRRTAHRQGIIILDGTDSYRQSVHPKVLTFIDHRILISAIGEEACQLVPLLDLPPKKTPNYLVLAKGNPSLKRLMYKAMMRMAESGLISRLKSKWLDSINTMCTTSSDVEPLSFGNVLASMMVLPLGIVASLVISISECVWVRQIAKRERLHIARLVTHELKRLK